MKELNKVLFERFVRVAKPFWISEEKKSARTLLLALLLLLVLANGAQLGIVSVYGTITTALSEKDIQTFWKMLWIYFACLVLAIPFFVFKTWIQQKLGIRWRCWLTGNFLDKYLNKRAYYRLGHSDQIDNPDERLHQDIRAFCDEAISFLLRFFSSSLSLCVFTVLLWTIYPPLCFGVLVYSIAGTIATVLYGRKLVGLNFSQLRKEADFRYSLVHVRKNLESIAFNQGEAQEGQSIRRRLSALVTNFDELIAWQRNLSFLTTGHHWLVLIIPSLIIAPLYFAGGIKFGVVAQANFAFAQMLADLSIIVTSFQELSSFAAITNRLGAFLEALDNPVDECRSSIVAKQEQTIRFDKVTVVTPDKGHVLVKELSLVLQEQQRLLITGPSGVGKSSILRTLAGLWTAGNGTVYLPEMNAMMFLPQRPYMSLGTLRDQLLYPGLNIAVSDEMLLAVLKDVNLEHLALETEALNHEIDWSEVLSVGEQQRLCFARILIHKPYWVILDEATCGLDMENERRLYSMLKSSGMNYVSVGHRSSLLEYHDLVLEVSGDCTWRLSEDLARAA